MLKKIKVITKKGFNLNRMPISNGTIGMFNLREIYKLLCTRCVQDLYEINDTGDKSVRVTVSNYKDVTDWSKIVPEKKEEDPVKPDDNKPQEPANPVPEPIKPDEEDMIQKEAKDPIPSVANITKDTEPVNLKDGEEIKSEPFKPEQDEENVETVEMGYDMEDGIEPTENEIKEAEEAIKNKK